MRIILLGWLCLVLALPLSAQKEIITGKKISPAKSKNLEKHFKHSNVFEISSKKLRSMVQEKDFQGTIQFDFGEEYNWEILLSENEIRAENYRLVVQTEAGPQIMPRSPLKSYKGILNNDPSEEVRLTIDVDFIYGYITHKGIKHFIEPLQSFQAEETKEAYVIYKETDVIPTKDNKCAATEMHAHAHDHSEDHEQIISSEKSQACYEVELAIASDFSMVQRYGSATNVENYTIGVMNNVGTDYDDEFEQEIKFKIVTQFISNCSNCDPWTANTAAGSLLDSFRGWGQANGFGIPFDLGQIWTNRDFDGGTIGVAYITSFGTACTGLKYHAIQNFSTNANLTRVVVSHEIGHNFSSGHDNGGGFIMSPFVNNSTQWSSNSQNAINNSVNSKIASGCFSLCSTTPPSDDEPSIPLTISVLSASDETCRGYEDGAIQVFVEGGKPDYLYFWNVPGNSDSQENLAPGTYFCSVVDEFNNVAITPAIVINGSDEDLAITVEEVIHADCDGGFTGAIDISVSGGEPGYFHFWSNRYDTEDQVDIPAGEYDVTVVDAFGCFQTSDPIIVDAGDLPSVEINDAELITCLNEVIMLDASGSSNGTGLTYQWTTVDGNIVSGENSLTPMVNMDGTYLLTIINENDGCENFSEVIVEQNKQVPFAMIAASEEINCNNTSLTLDASASDQNGNFEYEWTSSNGGNILNGASTLNPEVSAAGDYILTITDLDNGCSSSSSINIQENLSVPQISYEEPELITCINGLVNLEVSSDITDVSYSWNSTDGDITGGSNINSANVQVTEAGEYEVVLTNLENGCTNSLIIDVFENLETPTAIAGESFTLNCYTAVLNLNGFGSSSGDEFNYLWTTSNGNILSGETTLNPNVDLAGIYTLVVSNSENGCTAENTVEIFEDFSTPDVSLISGGEIDCQNAQTEITATDQNNNADQFTWSSPDGNIISGNGTNTIIVDAAGEYTLTSTNSTSGCSVSNSIIIEADQGIPFADAGEDLVLNCNNPTITLNGNTGTSTDLIWSWSGIGFVSGEESLNPVVDQAGTYVLTVTNLVNGCIATNAVEVSADFEEPFADAGMNTSIGCGEELVFLDASNSSTGQNLSYLWETSNGQIVGDNTNIQIQVNAAGEYTLTVINDLNGCTSTAMVQVDQASDLEANIIQESSNLCNGDALASASVQVLNGSAPYDYQWSNGLNTMQASNLSAGTYNVSVSDALGCNTSLSIVIDEPAALSLDSNVSDETFFNGTDGVISLDVSGGSPPYAYSWSNSSNQSTNFNLFPGEYSVTISDANGCSLESTFQVEAYLCGFEVALQLSEVLCFGENSGSISSSVIGEVGEVEYTWYDESENIIGKENVLTDLSAGTYTILAENGDGCFYENSVTLAEASEITLDIIDTQLTGSGANDGSLEALVSGGLPPYNYSWNTGGVGSTLENLAPGIYVLEVTDANGCKALIEGIIEDVDCNINGTISGQNASCFDADNGEAILNISTGQAPFIINWSNGPEVLENTNLPAGIYMVTVIDALDCPMILSVEIEEPPALESSFTSSNISCNGESDGSIDFDFMGGTAPYSFFVNDEDSATDLMDLTAGIYEVQVIDVNGCSISETIELTEPAALNLSATINDVSINGMSDGSIDIEVSGGTLPYNFQWSNGAETEDQLNLEPGIYSVIIRDANACEIIGEYSIEEPGALTANVVQGNVNCFEGNDGFASVEVNSGTPPYNYSWSTGEETAMISNLIAGSYNVEIEDATGLIINLNFEITQPEQIITFGSSEAVTCFGDQDGQAEINAEGGVAPFSYIWEFGSTDQTASGLEAGTYQVTVIDANDCIAIHDVAVGGPDDFTYEFSIENVSCFGGNDGSISVISNGGNGELQINWSNGFDDSLNEELEAGEYSFTISDELGCTDEQNLFVDQPDQIVIDLLNIVNAVGDQNDGSIEVSVEGGIEPYQYNWSNGATTKNISELPPGEYYLEVLDANDCLISSAVFVVEMTVSVNNTHPNFDLNVFPNPSSGTFYLTLSGTSRNESFRYSVYDLLGSEVLSDLKASGNEIIKIDLEQEESGVYFLKLDNVTGQQTIKIMKF